MAYAVSTNFLLQFDREADSLFVGRSVSDEAGNSFPDLYEVNPLGYDEYYGQLNFYNSVVLNEPLGVRIQSYNAMWRNDRTRLAVIISNFFKDSVHQPTDSEPTFLKMLLERLPL